MGDIPSIDLSPFIEGAPESPETVAAIAAACRDWGFFQVTGHGIATNEIEALWQAVRGFFALPLADKRRLLRSKDNPLGYFDRELTKNARDLKEIIDFGPDLRNGEAVGPDGENRWPDEDALPGFRATMTGWQDRCAVLSQCIMQAFCLGLGEPADRLDRYFAGRHTTFLRLNHYPVEDVLGGDAGEAAEAPPLGDMALHHHTDAGVLTVLLQDEVGGLQVEANGTWIDIAPSPGALVINIGDMSQVWSNGQYHAALHRVRPVPGVSRYSLPFFYNPAFDAIVEPLPATLKNGAATPNGGARYRPVSWSEFRGRRAEGDYADYGDELQISDYLPRTA